MALIWIAVFGAVVLALFGYVYWSTAALVLSRADASIAAEQAALQQIDDHAGHAGLAAAIEQRIADRRFDDHVYLLADPSFAPIAGNLAAWPAALAGSVGRGNLTAPDWKPDAARRPLVRA
ncbi:MAG TPA: hypothetical protein VFF43_21030, partial [Caldimonas sp.]|nr:hypothetical protein [Caldimonas sp.]